MVHMHACMSGLTRHPHVHVTSNARGEEAVTSHLAPVAALSFVMSFSSLISAACTFLHAERS
jgi:hypothetical protein